MSHLPQFQLAAATEPRLWIECMCNCDALRSKGFSWWQQRLPHALSASFRRAVLVMAAPDAPDLPPPEKIKVKGRGNPPAPPSRVRRIGLPSPLNRAWVLWEMCVYSSRVAVSMHLVSGQSHGDSVAGMLRTHAA